MSSSQSPSGRSSRHPVIRLLNINSYRFQEFRDFSENEIPRYIIASHRWSRYEQIATSSTRRSNAAVSTKIQGFCRAIKEHEDDIEWLWIDSVCIKPHEVDYAISSMFQWYRNAEACYAYLWDVRHSGAIGGSDWFKRGWTLQELIAPEVVVFFSGDWNLLGHKCPSHRVEHKCDTYLSNLNFTLWEITGINRRVLDDFNFVRNLSVAEILRWIIKRETTEEEDLFYSLMGILGVSIPLRYGEGRTMAWKRLYAAITRIGNRASATARGRRSNAPSQQAASTNPTLLQTPVSVSWDQGAASRRSRRVMVRYEDEEHEQDEEDDQGNESDQTTLSKSMGSLYIDPMKAAGPVGSYGRMSGPQPGPSSQSRLRTGAVGTRTTYTSGAHGRPSSGSANAIGNNLTSLREALVSTFRCRDDASSKLYTVVRQDDDFIQIFLSGDLSCEIGVRLKQGSGDPRESKMRQVYEQSGRCSATDVVALLRTCKAMQQSSRRQAEDDDSDDSEDDVEDDAASDAS